MKYVTKYTLCINKLNIVHFRFLFSYAKLFYNHNKPFFQVYRSRERLLYMHTYFYESSFMLICSLIYELANISRVNNKYISECELHSAV